jgi:hypothetical protein
MHLNDADVYRLNRGLTCESGLSTVHGRKQSNTLRNKREFVYKTVHQESKVEWRCVGPARTKGDLLAAGRRLSYLTLTLNSGSSVWDATP